MRALSLVTTVALATLVAVGIPVPAAAAPVEAGITVAGIEFIETVDDNEIAARQKLFGLRVSNEARSRSVSAAELLRDPPQ